MSRRDDPPLAASASPPLTVAAARDRIFADVAVALDPPPFVPALEWCPANLCIPNETESPGRFNLDLMPHIAEVLQAANDPKVRRIILRWAHRTSKTFTGLSLQIYWLRTSYLPQVLVGSDKANTRDTRDELYRYIEASGFGELLLPPHARSDRFIQLGSRRLKIRNAGSKTDLSGYAACFGHAVEFAKSPYECDGIEFLVGNAEEFSFDEPFDVVTSFETIEHLPNPKIFLALVYQHLKPNGLLLLSVPIGETRHIDGYHLHVFERNDIYHLLADAGFQVKAFRFDDWKITSKELIQ